MYHLPQEIEVWYIIPAIRKELAKLLTSKYDKTYQQVGNMIGVSKSAVSQYLSKKRATKIKIPNNIKKEIKKSAKIISKDEDKVVKEIIRILDLMKQDGCCCEVCKKYNKGIINKCGMEPIKRE